MNWILLNNQLSVVISLYAIYMVRLWISDSGDLVTRAAKRKRIQLHLDKVWYLWNNLKRPVGICLHRNVIPAYAISF